MNAALLVGLALTTFGRDCFAGIFLSKVRLRQKEQNKSKRWSPKLQYSSIIKERRLSRISERRRVSGSTVTRICLSTI